MTGVCAHSLHCHRHSIVMSDIMTAGPPSHVQLSISVHSVVELCCHPFCFLLDIPAMSATEVAQNCVSMRWAVGISPESLLINMNTHRSHARAGNDRNVQCLMAGNRTHLQILCKKVIYINLTFS